jgi:hypothetical protein
MKNGRKWYLLEFNGNRLVASTEKPESVFSDEEVGIAVLENPFLVALSPVAVPSNVVGTDGKPKMEMAFNLQLIPYPLKSISVYMDQVSACTLLSEADPLYDAVKGLRLT